VAFVEQQRLTTLRLYLCDRPDATAGQLAVLIVVQKEVIADLHLKRQSKSVLNAPKM
jgi:hypothetical protein